MAAAPKTATTKAQVDRARVTLSSGTTFDLRLWKLSTGIYRLDWHTVGAPKAYAQKYYDRLSDGRAFMEAVKNPVQVEQA